jgi:hypothetical protein
MNGRSEYKRKMVYVSCDSYRMKNQFAVKKYSLSFLYTAPVG